MEGKVERVRWICRVWCAGEKLLKSKGALTFKTVKVIHKGLST